MFFFSFVLNQASLVTQTVKNLPTMQKTQDWSLGWEDFCMFFSSFYWSTIDK